MEDTLTLRAATEEDIPFLLELRRETMVQHQMASGVHPSEEERIRRVRVAFDNARIILHAGKPAGLFKVVRDGAEWDLVQIQLALRCKGAGSAPCCCAA